VSAEEPADDDAPTTEERPVGWPYCKMTFRHGERCLKGNEWCISTDTHVHGKKCAKTCPCRTPWLPS
jgi:hypothetical protein